MDERTRRVTGVLGDQTRHNIYQHIVNQTGDRVSVLDIAKRFSLHPNVARLHLTKLADVGLLESTYEKPTRGGRPGRLYTLSGEGITLHFPPRDYKLLCELTLETLASLGEVGLKAVIDRAKQRGHQEGLKALSSLPQEVSGRPSERQAGPSRNGGGPEGHRAVEIRDGQVSEYSEYGGTRKLLEHSLEVIRDLGFHPEVRHQPNGECNLIIKNCIFHEAAKKYPDTVCNLCHALLRGLLGSYFETVNLREKTCVAIGDRCCEYHL